MENLFMSKMRPNIDAAKRGCGQRARSVGPILLSLIHLALQPVHLHSLKLLMILMLRGARIQLLVVNFL